MTVNNPGNPEIHISEEKLQKFGLVLLGIAVFFTIIGAMVSPLDDQGKPVLLLPEVKEVEDYRRSAQTWISELTVLDGEIAHVIATKQQGDLFSQSRSAQQTLQHAVELAQQVDRTRVPPIGMGLHTQMLATTLSYLEAARSALQWVSAPEKNNLDQATPKTCGFPQDEGKFGGKPVVDLSLEEFQRNQSIRISRDIIGQSEEHEQKMQTNAQKLWENAHKQLVALLRFLDQDYDESCEKANRPLESFNDEDLAYLIYVRLRAMQGDASRKEKPDAMIEVKRSLNELSQKYAELEKVNAGLLQTNTRLQAEKAALDAHLAALRQVQKDVADQAIQAPKPLDDNLYNPHPLTFIPDWMKTWQASNVFEKSSTAILVMGETGMALRPSIKKIMAKRLSLSEANKNLDEALNCLMTPEKEADPILIEAVDGIPKEGSSSGGNPPDVLHLTEHGKVAYQALTGQVPKENEYDRMILRHSSPEHTILNIQAAEKIMEEGFQLRGQAQEIQLANGESFIPDIIAADPKSGEVIFIEVERDVHKDQMARKQKWMKLFEASNGNLYVFCDNLNCQRVIQGEINIALGGLVYNSFLTNLHGLRKGKRSEKDGSIWLTQLRGK